MLQVVQRIAGRLLRANPMTVRAIRTDVATTPPLSLDRELRSAVAGMSRRLRGVPQNFRAFVYDVTRQEKRAKPMGNYPAYALTCIRSGAPLSDVEGPLNEVRGWIRSHFPRITDLASALEGLGKESGEANVAALKLMRTVDKPCRNAVDELIKELNEMIAAAETVRDALYEVRYTDQRQNDGRRDRDKGAR